MQSIVRNAIYAMAFCISGSVFANEIESSLAPIEIHLRGERADLMAKILQESGVEDRDKKTDELILRVEGIQCRKKLKWWPRFFCSLSYDSKTLEVEFQKTNSEDLFGLLSTGDHSNLLRVASDVKCHRPIDPTSAFDCTFKLEP